MDGFRQGLVEIEVKPCPLGWIFSCIIFLDRGSQFHAWVTIKLHLEYYKPQLRKHGPSVVSKTAPKFSLQVSFLFFF